jgi:hypothetical protein
MNSGSELRDGMKEKVQPLHARIPPEEREPTFIRFWMSHDAR